MRQRATTRHCEGMKLHALVAALSIPAVTSLGHADTLGAEPNDYGKVTHITKGVKEIDLGGIFVLSHSKVGDGEGSTRVSSLSGIGFQYFINDNFSAGATALFGYDRLSSDSYSTGFGGMAFASLHVRLGLGAFLRPLIGAGVLVGNLSTETAPGMTSSASQVSGLVRIGLPFAYFPSKRVVLQAGPELDVSVGSTNPDVGDSQSFTTVTGGFGVSVGYAF
jgi:hypothetical protein